MLEAGRVFERFHRSGFFTNQPLNMFVGCVGALNLCETTGTGAELTTAYANMAQLCGVLPVHGWARSYLAKANRMLDAASDPAVESLLRLVEGVYFLGIGAIDVASRQVELGIAVAERIGYHRRREECLAVRAAMDLFGGHWSRAARWITALEASARPRGDRQMLAWCLNQKLDACILTGDHERARRHMAELWEFFPDLNEPDRLWTLGLAAYAHLQMEEWDVAEARAREGTLLAVRIPPVYSYCITAQDRLAETWRRLGEHTAQARGKVDAGAMRQLQSCAKALARSARTFPVARPLALLHEGTIDALSGRRDRAVKSWRRGLLLATEMQQVLPGARLSSALAHTVETPGERRELSQRARAALEALAVPSGNADWVVPAPDKTAQLAM